MLHGGNHPSITKHATMITWPHMQCWCKICLAWYRMRVWNLCCCTHYLINISSLYYNEYSVTNKVFGTEGCSMENCIFPIYQRYSMLRASGAIADVLEVNREPFSYNDSLWCIVCGYQKMPMPSHNIHTIRDESTVTKHEDIFCT